jgi:non-specific serine/threonine protein kinase
MRAALAWSAELLTPAERTLFRRLAVFVGGCSLEAAEAVCVAPEGAELLTIDLLDGLGALVDQSLVDQREEGGTPRLSMLHVVREFALEQLDQQSEEALAVHQAHAAYFQALGAEAEPHVWGVGQVEWVRRLEREHDNLRAVLGWLRDRREVESALRLAVAIGNFWYIRGHYEEGARWVESLLASPGTVTPAVRVRALYRAGVFAWARGDVGRCGALGEEALALARTTGDVEGSALSLSLRAFAALEEGQLDRAVAYADQAVTAARQAGVRGTLGIRLNIQGHVLLRRGELERALAVSTEALDLSRAQGDEDTQAMCLELLSAVACRQRDAADARRYAAEALELLQPLEDPAAICLSLLLLAGVAALEGQFKRAGRLLGFADSMVGHSETVSSYGRSSLDDLLSSAQEALGEDAWAAAISAGRALSLQEAIAEALGEER